MNKIYMVSIVFLTLINLVKAQESDINWLIGRWQIDQAELTSMNFDMYNFHKDGTFVFAPNAYNGLNRIIEIKGIYLLQGDTILLTPKFIKEVFGGYPVRSEITTLSDTCFLIFLFLTIFFSFQKFMKNHLLLKFSIVKIKKIIIKN